MEQQIRFCTSSDGTRIAYATVGQGPPVVRIRPWFTHLEFEWKNPMWRSSIERLSARHLLIRHDGRGMGLSDHQVSDYSPEAHVRDLEAVVDALGLERFALYGVSQGGATSITYAVRYPERVSHLILQASFASATRALECTIAMQRAFAAHNESADEPIAEDEDLFGTAVIMAARIAAKAKGGEIVASDVVRQLVAGKGSLFSDRGDVALRGFEDPLRLYEVRWRE